jgi:hypothetical protein
MVINAMQFLAVLRFMDGLWGWSGGRKAATLQQLGQTNPEVISERALINSHNDLTWRTKAAVAYAYDRRFVRKT